MSTFDELRAAGDWPARPLVMGIVNVTPDSFSDGGRTFRWERAVEHGLRLLDEGADLVDVGGESTRPGAAPVEPDQETERVVPVISALAGETDSVVSVDTRHAAVADAALDAGAQWVNDVTGLRDPDLLALVAARGVGVCIMHMQGEPRSMQDDPHYDDVVAEVTAFLDQRARAARTAGVEADRIWLDPGIGFGKSLEHNLRLMAALDRIAALGYPVLLGASRKRFIEKLTGDPVDQRLGGSLAAAGCALDALPAVVRVHDVRATRQYLRVRDAIREASARPAPDATA